MSFANGKWLICYIIIVGLSVTLEHNDQSVHVISKLIKMTLGQSVFTLSKSKIFGTFLEVKKPLTLACDRSLARCNCQMLAWKGWTW